MTNALWLQIIALYLIRQTCANGKIGKDVTKLKIQTNIKDDDFDILTDFCIKERVSVSAVVRTLVTNFLDTTDTAYRNQIIEEALKIKVGRPKAGDY